MTRKRIPGLAVVALAVAVAAVCVFVLAWRGHTHAGTVRLPLVGAVVSPWKGDAPGWTRFPELRGLHVTGFRQRENV